MTELSSKRPFIQVPLFESIYSNEFTLVQLRHVFDSIFREHYSYRINLIRSEPDKAKRNIIKCTLPSFCPSATFFKFRSILDINQMTGLISLDFDDIDFNSFNVSLLQNDEYVFCYFKSPSGNGLKIFIIIEQPLHNFKNAFFSLSKYFEEKYNLISDKACSDASRLCFLSSDDSLYSNFNSKTFSNIIIPDKKPPFLPGHLNFVPNCSLVDNIVNQILKYRIDITSDYHDWITICYSLISEFGINALKIFVTISQFHPDFDPDKTIKQFNNCLKNPSHHITIKSFYYIAKLYGVSYL